MLRLLKIIFVVFILVLLPLSSRVVDIFLRFSTRTYPTIPIYDGSGGPILVVSSKTNPFGRYQVEILRAQGYTSFKAADITEVEANPAMLNSYDVILLGPMKLNAEDVSLLTTWTTKGGTLIAQRPCSLLYPLMGITSEDSSADNYKNTYLLVDTLTGKPGHGIVDQTIQYHGVADLYTMLPVTTSLATLYSSPTTSALYPAVTSVSVGSNGGNAIAFAFDLAKSVVLTRQGNIAWSGQSRDGQAGPIRSDNLFYPDYVDFSKIQIPQADELQYLLTNIISLDNLHRKPLPHVWILPRGLKAAIVMTGDDHNIEKGLGFTGTPSRFNDYRLMSKDNSEQAVEDWRAIRATSYVYDNINLSNDSVVRYQSLGFEIAFHPTTQCGNFTRLSLANQMTSQLSRLETKLPGMLPPVTNRTHCMPWSDWTSQPKVENSLGIRFDVNYYYWPNEWVRNRPGLFTGSGMPMRFADSLGTLIDCYQAPTQIPDDSGLDITNSINTLLDNAINKGYYGAFVMNMHTDTAMHIGSDQIITAAMTRQVPVISSRQMLTWLDNRNSTDLSHVSWDNITKTLSFTLITSAHNLQVMVPAHCIDGELVQVIENGTPVEYTIQTIKGIEYAFFPGSTRGYNYIAVYSKKSR